MILEQQQRSFIRTFDKNPTLTTGMDVKAKSVVEWVESNLPPLSWQIIVMQNMKVFLKHKISPSKFTDSTLLNPEIVRSINQSIKERYQRELPF
jgi:hypothetical protein